MQGRGLMHGGKWRACSTMTWKERMRPTVHRLDHSSLAGTVSALHGPRSALRALPRSVSRGSTPSPRLSTAAAAAMPAVTKNANLHPCACVQFTLLRRGSDCTPPSTASEECCFH
jgi:hypothetical protein